MSVSLNSVVHMTNGETGMGRATSEDQGRRGDPTCEFCVPPRTTSLICDLLGADLRGDRALPLDGVRTR